MKPYSLSALLPVLALALPLQAAAQDVTCADIQWSPELRQQFPEIDEACQEVIVRDGQRFARFDATFRDYRPSRGDVRLSFALPDNRSVTHVFRLDRNLRVKLNGREYTFQEIPRRQELSVYIPERSMALATLGLDTQELDVAEAEIVDDEPEVLAEYGDEEAMAETEMAQMETERLPDTASNWPLIGLLGLMLLALAGGLRLVQRRS